MHVKGVRKLSEAIIKTHLEQAIIYANNSIIQYGNIHKEARGMGTTIIVGWFINDQIYLAWIGDSRAYLYRKGEGLRQLSMDHSLVQELINNGELTEAQAFYHPNKNIITQSLGDARHEIKVDIRKYATKKEDYLLLCSDGLNGMLTDEEIGKIIEINYGDELKCADALVKAANADGGMDNITVALGVIEPISATSAITKTKKSTIGVNWNHMFSIIGIGLLFFSFFIYFNKHTTQNNLTRTTTSIEKDEQQVLQEPNATSVDVSNSKETRNNRNGAISNIVDSNISVGEQDHYELSKQELNKVTTNLRISFVPYMADSVKKKEFLIAIAILQNTTHFNVLACEKLIRVKDILLEESGEIYQDELNNIRRLIAQNCV